MSLEAFVEHVRGIEVDSEEGRALSAALQDRDALRTYASRLGVTLSPAEEDDILSLPASSEGEALLDDQLETVTGGAGAGLIQKGSHKHSIDLLDPLVTFKTC